MLNPELLRRDPDKTRMALARRDEEAVRAFDAAVEADVRWRNLTAQVEVLRAERNERSRAIRGTPSPEQREQLQDLRERLSVLEQQLQAVEKERDELLRAVPNIPDQSVPPGKDDSQNVMVRAWGEPRQFDFEPLPHWDLATRLGILDLEAGAR